MKRLDGWALLVLPLIFALVLLVDPETHLVWSCYVIYVLVGISLWMTGRAAYRIGGLFPALLAQSSPFLLVVIPKMALHPKPEPFMVMATALLAAVCFQVAAQRKAGDRHAVLAGVVMGFGIVCKIHFAALGVVPLLMFDRRRIAIYAGATIVSFAVFFAPALPSLDIWLGWLKRIILASGAYGEGPQTVIDPARFPTSILSLFSGRWFFTGGFIVSLLALAGYARLRRRGLIEPDPLARMLAGMLLGHLATIVLIAKQPAPHYLVPALMLTGPTLACLWAMTAKWFPRQGHRRAWAGLALIIVVVTTISTVRTTGITWLGEPVAAGAR